MAQKQIVFWGIATAITALVCGALVFVITTSVGDNGSKGFAAGIAIACVICGFLLHLVLYKLIVETRVAKPLELPPMPDIEAQPKTTDPAAEVLQRDEKALAEVYRSFETDGTKLYMTVRTQAVLGPDRLNILKKKVRKVEAITQDEADKIISLFVSEEDGLAAYEIMSEKIMSREAERHKKTKRKHQRSTRESTVSTIEENVEEKVEPVVI